MHDIVISGGTIVDGTGEPAFTGDVAISNGVITAVGHDASGAAKRRIDADGLVVTPGWVDVHTHYDGQVTWDEDLEPSATNGVTTLVMGNCGVGFAPVRPGEEAPLIELMEGVEDIPGSALAEGIPWGTWETFPQYLDYLATRRYSIDIGTQVAHGALRFYAMGQRGVDNLDATPDEISAMARLVGEAMNAGALGFSTSRTIGHRSLSGTPVPGTFAADGELTAIAAAMGRGVFEAIPAGTVGALEALGGERAKPVEEVMMLAEVSRKSGRPITFTTIQIAEDVDHWREVLETVSLENARGAKLRPQIAPRAVTVMTSLGTYHMFMRKATYLRDLAHLPIPERVREMRRPEVKAAVLADRSVPSENAGSMQAVVGLYARALNATFPLNFPIDYEPTREESVVGRARSLGVSAESLMYDLLLEDEGRAFYAIFGSNFAKANLDASREMLLHPDTVTGLSDAGAHVNFICDCTMPTFHLTHWVRDRSRGPRIGLEFAVNKLSKNNADLYGLTDRGSITVGKRADLNVIDFDNLTIQAPFVRHDLPAGGSRVLQPSTGYKATMVNGVVTRLDDNDTGERPGRLVRGR
ncbi:MAG: D-aminoacylase [Actinobacteria bacterium]|jgi:N-acyl-D-aspartate/D-glutamate deacylase|nr:D-aminoacylase [Actinomycetota bacterium]NBP53704.1 D-aminoacylase [Actinomycetota bacterium]